ncbi:sugar ABC transporter substrate-binding protein [Leucobacter sp.]
MKTRRPLIPVILAGALLLAGCSSPSQNAAENRQSTDGQPQPTVESVDELKVAYFSAGSSNQYLQAAIDEAKSYAGERGFALDVFDGEFDAQVQFDQMQTALTSGKYNAFAVEPNDGNLVCNLLTQDAPAAGVMVAVFNLPICGRATNLGEETWEPGTVNYVGGQTLDVYEAWVDQGKQEYPDGAKIALISGPDLNANSIAFFQAAEAFAEGPWEVVAQQTTDYTTPQAFQAAQTIMQANPELDVIMSNFSGMTRGVLQATAGSEVAVFDFGGDQWALDNVESGSLASTIMMLPRQETRYALQGLVELVEGESTPKFVNLAALDSLPGGSPFVYPDNVDEYEAEY